MNSELYEALKNLRVFREARMKLPWGPPANPDDIGLFAATERIVWNEYARVVDLVFREDYNLVAEGVLTSEDIRGLGPNTPVLSRVIENLIESVQD